MNQPKLLKHQRQELDSLILLCLPFPEGNGYIIPWLLLPKLGERVMGHREMAEITVNISEYKRQRMHEPLATHQALC